tara:strand:+ start:136 stop:366 length:231 start_codon:yes stop_codon:yes gene_type:complete
MMRANKSLERTIMAHAESMLRKEIEGLRSAVNGSKWITPTPEKRAEYTINGIQHYKMAGGTYIKCSIINQINTSIQ